MNRSMLEKLCRENNDPQSIGILHALYARDQREEEAKREEKALQDAERDEAAALNLTVGQLRVKKINDINQAVTKSLQDVAPSEIRWLWPEKIPLGKVTLFSGDPDQGKSYVTLDLATRVSRGSSWPGEEEDAGKNTEETMGGGEEGKRKENAELAPLSIGTCADLGTHDILSSRSTLPVQAPVRSNEFNVGSVIIITSEDNEQDTIRPRLDAMGADVTKIHILTNVTRQGLYGSFSLNSDVGRLERAINNLQDCKLVIIDPLASYLELNGGGASSIRQALDPLKEMAQRTGVAVILVNHLSKGSGRALYRSLGSVSIIGMCRTAWGFARDKSDRSRRMMLPLKNNLSPDDSGFAFTILDGRVEWEDEPVETTIDEAMRGKNRQL